MNHHESLKGRGGVVINRSTYADASVYRKLKDLDPEGSDVRLTFTKQWNGEQIYDPWIYDPWIS